MFSGVLSGVFLQSIWMVINHNSFLSLTFKWDGFPVFWKRSSSVMAVSGAGWYFTFSVRTFPHLWVWKGMKNTIWVTSKQKNSICPWGYLKALFPQHSSSLVGEPSLFHIISVISCSVWILFSAIFPPNGFCPNKRVILCVWELELSQYLLIFLQPFSMSLGVLWYSPLFENLCESLLFSPFVLRICLLIFLLRLWSFIFREEYF